MTKNYFPLTHCFWCYQTLKYKENYLYTKFSIKTNRAELERKKIHYQLMNNSKEREDAILSTNTPFITP